MFILIWAALAAAVPFTTNRLARDAITIPRLKNAIYVGNVTDPSLTRDSCGSSRIGDRVLWTCRDTQVYDQLSNLQTAPVMTNSASWTNLSTSGGPDLRPGPVGVASNGTNNILQMYGGHPSTFPAYFPLQSHQCPNSGACEDGVRWVVWQDQPPLITQEASDGSAVGYTWVPNQRIGSDWDCLDQEPSYTLYRSTYKPSTDLQALPDVSLVSSSFYTETQVGFGRYGNLIHNKTAYLYGQTANRDTVLARVPINMIESRDSYEYYNAAQNSWTSTPPAFSNTIAAYILPSAGAGGQGTFYHSSYYKSFLWIGQDRNSVTASFYISRAPAPEGPWTQPEKLFDGQNGDHPIAQSYSLQAHPSLLASRDVSENGIYLSWTQAWKTTSVGGGFVTPLVWVEFE